MSFLIKDQESEIFISLIKLNKDLSDLSHANSYS